jgi:cyclic beta-1,2-glucan synthetase
VGAHGLPLIGTGDWNDGMNRVGHRGQGESVWLGWFLYANLQLFAPIARMRGDAERAQRWLDHAAKLKAALEANAWDGAWYRRAYFDDGTPLGSAANDECRIDAIAQSWALISGAADPQRALRAMESLDRHLLRRGDELALLFTPPFDHSPHDPGYIKAYVPGVRENGGQYTHAGVWTLIAYALLGDGDTAFDVFGMLNPVSRASTRTGIHAYRVEPYVVAADVYSCSPHVRLGGWTWYTGAAGWLYRAGLEWILGVRIRADRLELKPCVPREWRSFSARFHFGRAVWTIDFDNPDGVMSGVARVVVDGEEQPVGTQSLELRDEPGTHAVQVVLGMPRQG